MDKSKIEPRRFNLELKKGDCLSVLRGTKAINRDNCYS